MALSSFVDRPGFFFRVEQRRSKACDQHPSQVRLSYRHIPVCWASTATWIICSKAYRASDSVAKLPVDANAEAGPLAASAC